MSVTYVTQDEVEREARALVRGAGSSGGRPSGSRPSPIAPVAAAGHLRSQDDMERWR